MARFMYLKQLTHDQQAKLLKVIAKKPDGASIDELEDYAGLGLPRRTLQRRINVLVKQGALRVTGQTRATRYHVVAQLSPVQAPLVEQQDDKTAPVPATFQSRGPEYIDLKRRFSSFIRPESEASDDYIAAWQF